ncbi:MAG: hypothetical protein J2P59_02150 [Acidimicrobiales bacterium]|nr:hypothetical protein [Acidimicrobiales bacterium]
MKEVLAMAMTVRNQARVADLLDSNDDTVARLLAELHQDLPTDERVGLVGRLVRAVSVHDAVIAEALCPLLCRLPGGATVADEMREGCELRESVSAEIIALLSGIAARDVYLVPSEGKRLDDLVASLTASFEHHEQAEVPKAVAVVDEDPSAPATEIATAMEHARRWAPTRPHRGPLAHRRAMAAKALLHLLDRMRDLDARFNEGTF